MKKIINMWLKLNNLEEMRLFSKKEIFLSLLSSLIGIIIFSSFMILIWRYGIFINLLTIPDTTELFLDLEPLNKILCSMLGFIIFGIFTLPLQSYKQKYLEVKQI